MTFANPTQCEVDVSSILNTSFTKLPEHERWLISELCGFLPASYIAEQIGESRSVKELMKALKKLGVNTKADSNELREAIADVKNGKAIQEVADALANKMNAQVSNQKSKEQPKN